MNTSQPHPDPTPPHEPPSTQTQLPVSSPNSLDFVNTSIAIIPPAARPLVRPTVRLVSLFVTIFTWVLLALTLIVASVLTVVPVKIHAFGILFQTILVVMSVTFFAVVCFILNAKRIDLEDQLDRLARFVEGDVSVAGSMAYDIASEASTTRLKVLMDMMDGMASAKEGEEMTEVDLEEGQAGLADEATRLLGKDVHGMDEGEMEGVAAGRVMEAVTIGMEGDPMFAVKEVVRMVIRGTFVWIVVMPAIYFGAGYALCKLGAPFNGTELILTALVVAIVSSMAWGHVKERSAEGLTMAEEQIREMLVEREKERVRREEERKRKEEEEAEKRRKEAEGLKELEEQNEQKKEGEKKEQKANLFGIPLPF